MLHKWIFKSVPNLIQTERVYNRMISYLSRRREAHKGVAELFECEAEISGVTHTWNEIHIRGVGLDAGKTFVWPGLMPGEEIAEGTFHDGANTFETSDPRFTALVENCLKIAVKECSDRMILGEKVAA